VTPDELPGFLEALAERISRDGATPAVLAMAHTFERAVTRNLALTSHPAETFTPSPKGGFPSLISGDLRRSVFTTGGVSGGPVATASTGPHIFYAGIQEYGHDMHAHSTFRPMTWRNEGRWWSRYHVHVPPRPYMRPTIATCIANGSLGRAAGDAFEIAIWGA
jgi:phage gpG-like protein